MTELTRLKVSLTKHGAHKAFVLLRDLSTADVLDHVWNKHDGIKIDRAQTRQNLSAFADGNLPGLWDRAKELSEDTLRQLVFLAIVFSHHKVIEAFQNGSSGNGMGEIRRGAVLDAKAFTNIKNDIIELGFSTSHSTNAVAYDLTEIASNLEIGDLASKLLTLKLQSAGWNNVGTIADECVRLGFHAALSQSEGAFRTWISENDLEGAAPIVAIPDPNIGTVKAFLFKPGHNPSKEGTSARRKVSESVEATLTHNMLQSKLYQFLSGKYGNENVGTEQPSGTSANSIDLVVKAGEEMIFYELKTNPSIRLSIREALPQLLEYAYWPAETRCSKLVIVAEAEVTQDAVGYLNKLRSEFKIPVFYARIDRQTGQLSDTI